MKLGITYWDFEVRTFFFKTLQSAGASIAIREQAALRVLKKTGPNAYLATQFGHPRLNFCSKGLTLGGHLC